MRLAELLRGRAGEPGIVIALNGDLGVGKTLFVRGLAIGLGHDPSQVSSPTFVIAHQYGMGSERPLSHVDFYRIEDAMELEATGFFDLIVPAAVLAVEWAERFAGELPHDRLELTLERVGRADPTAAGLDVDAAAQLRNLHVRATGVHAQALLARWQPALDEAEPSASAQREGRDPRAETR